MFLLRASERALVAPRTRSKLDLDRPQYKKRETREELDFREIASPRLSRYLFLSFPLFSPPRLSRREQQLATGGRRTGSIIRRCNAGASRNAERVAGFSTALQSTKQYAACRRADSTFSSSSSSSCDQVAVWSSSIVHPSASVCALLLAHFVYREFPIDVSAAFQAPRRFHRQSQSISGSLDIRVFVI